MADTPKWIAQLLGGFGCHPDCQVAPREPQNYEWQPKNDGIDRQSSTVSQKPHHMGDLDAMLWGIEKDPLLRQTITVVLILDRAPDREVLLDRLERGSRTLPSFRHRLVEAPLRLSTPRWIVDPNFDLSYHVRWIGAPGDGSLDGVLEFARQSAMSGLDRERPLWTITVVEGLKGGQAA